MTGDESLRNQYEDNLERQIKCLEKLLELNSPWRKLRNLGPGIFALGFALGLAMR